METVLQRPIAKQTQDDQWSHDLFDGGSGRGGGGRRSAFDEPRTSTKLQINNLHYEVSERELEVRCGLPCLAPIRTDEQALFSQIGEMEKPPSIKVR
jgi:hypothetical protein